MVGMVRILVRRLVCMLVHMEEGKLVCTLADMVLGMEVGILVCMEVGKLACTVEGKLVCTLVRMEEDILAGMVLGILACRLLRRLVDSCQNCCYGSSLSREVLLHLKRPTWLRSPVVSSFKSPCLWYVFIEFQ